MKSEIELGGGLPTLGFLGPGEGDERPAFLSWNYVVSGRGERQLLSFPSQ